MISPELTSRADKIKFARENCSQRLGDFTPECKTKNYENTEEIHKIATRSDMNVKPVKMFLFRTVICLLLFGSIYMAKFYDFSYQEYNYKSVSTMISSDDRLEQLENTVSSFVKEKIIPIFHRP